MHENLGSKLFHPSSRPAGNGITIGMPRSYELFAAPFLGARRRCASRTLLAAVNAEPGHGVLDVGSGSAISRASWTRQATTSRLQSRALGGAR